MTSIEQMVNTVKISNRKNVVIHIAIIGLGSIGRRHLRGLREIRPELKITLVRYGKGQKWPEVQLADQVTDSLEIAVQSGIQAAIISSPSTEHIQQAVQLVKAGVHILIEKPLSNNLSGVSGLVNLIEENQLIGLIGYVLRYDPTARTFAKYIENKVCGKILHVQVSCGSYLPDWRPEQDYKESVSALYAMGGGVLLELSHELDYIRWFFKDQKSVQAYLYHSGTLGIEVEDSADIIFIGEEGYPIALHLDFNRRFPERICRVQGENGQLEWDAIQRKVVWRSMEGEEVVHGVQSEGDQIYKEQLLHFLACIESDEKPVVTVKDGAAVMKMVEAIRQADRSANKKDIR